MKIDLGSISKQHRVPSRKDELKNLQAFSVIPSGSQTSGYERGGERTRDRERDLCTDVG